ncbi:MAG: phosphate ABC transporter permease PstA [Chlorobiales bacterium]|nr:phosphate ABC transporter permease PstA [Chlorobiales bacterium]
MNKSNKQAGAGSSGTSRRERTIDIVNKRLEKRYRKEKRFRLYGMLSIIASVLFLAFLLTSIVSNGYSAFWQTYIKLDVQLDPDMIDKEDPGRSNYQGIIKQAIGAYYPEVKDRKERRELYSLFSSGAAFQLRDEVLKNPAVVGTTLSLWVLADDDVDMLMKGHIKRNVPENERRLNDKQLQWIAKLEAGKRIEERFNTTFFTAGDSREPELAGIWGAVKGSFYTMLVTLALSFPIGIAAAVYLEEFAPKNLATDFIEVNINNLAAVPSIVFGLLGLAVFLNFFGMPRSTPLVGGIVLMLMTLPTIIIASRAALKAVPPSIREAAFGVGSSKLQVVTSHVLPLALPGMLTGTIIGMAQALGETAPLLMIGMVAFIVDIPGGFTDPAAVMPVQIYLWADSPERAFVERTSAAIMVLLAFLISMNALAVVMRKRFERRW